jgi:hypothetical protein
VNGQTLQNSDVRPIVAQILSRVFGAPAICGVAYLAWVWGIGRSNEETSGFSFAISIVGIVATVVLAEWILGPYWGVFFGTVPFSFTAYWGAQDSDALWVIAWVMLAVVNLVIALLVAGVCAWLRARRGFKMLGSVER